MKTSLSFNLSKREIPFEILLRSLARNLRTHLGMYFRNVFYMTKKLVFSICSLLNLSIVKRIFHVSMFQLSMWQKSLTNICEVFHCFICVELEKKKLRDFWRAFSKECFSLYVTGTVSIPFRQAFPLAFFFFFSFIVW